MDILTDDPRTVMLKFLAALPDPESLTRMVNGNVPVAVGMPLMMPLDGDNSSPGGSAPPTRNQV